MRIERDYPSLTRGFRRRKMYILNEGRAAYLEFLRNLTPQIVVLTLMLVAGSKLNWRDVSSNTLAGHFLFWVLLAMFLSAAWANSAMFLERVSQFVQSKKPAIDNRFKEMSNWGKIKYVGRHHTWLFIQTLVVLAFVEIGLVSVIVIGAANASSLLKLLH